MHILYINHQLQRLDSEAAVWSRELILELQAAGANVVSVPDLKSADSSSTNNGGRLYAGLKSVVKRHAPWNVMLQLVEYRLMLSGLFRTVRMTWKLLRERHLRDCAVILARTYEYDWTPMIAAWLCKRPLVLEVHAPFYLERKLRGRSASRLLQRLERVQWRAADRIWVNSHELEDIIKKNLSTTRSVACIPHGFRAGQCQSSKRPTGDQTINLVFVGSFYHWHGVELLIEAFALARQSVGNLRLCLIGDGLTRPACEAKAQELRLGDSIEFTGWVPRNEVMGLLADSDIGVAPYTALESFYFDPVKIIEYMASGLAVIASKQGSIGRTIEDGKNGLLVPPDDVEALSETIVKLVRSPALRGRLGQAARAKIVFNQSWEVTAPQIISLCSAAVARGRQAEKLDEAEMSAPSANVIDYPLKRHVDSDLLDVVSK